MEDLTIVATPDENVYDQGPTPAMAVAIVNFDHLEIFAATLSALYDGSAAKNWSVGLEVTAFVTNSCLLIAFHVMSVKVGEPKMCH